MVLIQWNLNSLITESYHLVASCVSSARQSRHALRNVRNRRRLTQRTTWHFSTNQKLYRYPFQGLPFQTPSQLRLPTRQRSD